MPGEWYLMVMTEQSVEELIRKYAAGIASNDEIQTLMRWYRLDNVNEVRWPSSAADEKETVARRMLERLQMEISPKRNRLVHMRWLRIAALLLVSLGLSVLVYYLSPRPDSFVTVRNPTGKIQLIHLPDSSRVWLNASTTLHYRNKGRQVKLEGEAYFEVSHDAGHPFMVEAGEIQATVLGTSFDIKAYQSQAATFISVISGKVRVTDSSRQLGIVTPSFHLQYDRQNKHAKVAAIDTNAVLAWKNGKLQFQGETLGSIARTLENWYGIKINFSDPQMLHCRYYMTFDNTISLDRLLVLMAEITEMEYVYDRNKNIVILSGKECR
jgi:transmembrane sensor